VSAIPAVSAALGPVATPERGVRTGAPTVEIQDRVELSPRARLTPEEQQVVAQLAAIDRQVRAHEQAHLAAAGGYARSGPSYTYQTGPDGQIYAVGGEVSIDTSAVPGDPEATIRKAQIIRAAATAPANPSGQDLAVAAAATQMEMNARLEIAAQQTGTLVSVFL